MQEIRRFHQRYYAKTERLSQQNFILRHVTVETPARRRPRNGHEERQSKEVTTKYFMPCLRKESVINVPVCKTLFFSNTLGVKDGRLEKLCRDFFKLVMNRKKPEGETRNLEFT